MGKPVRRTFDKRSGEKNLFVQSHIGSRPGTVVLRNRGASRQAALGRAGVTMPERAGVTL